MSSTAARRYAKALFTLCTEQKAIEQVHADLSGLAALAETSPEWRTFVTAPHGALEKRASFINQALDGRVHAITQRFLAFIDRRRRITLLPSIIQEWQALHDEAHGIVRARVVSASPLAPEQLKTITDRLGQRCGKKVVLSHAVDAALVGGLKVFLGDTVFDYSIEGLLQGLQKYMISA